MRWNCCSAKTVHAVAPIFNHVKNPNHLICDDSSRNRMILARILRKSLNIQVDEAENAEAAVQMILKNGEYAIVWMDFALGSAEEENGSEVSARLRKDFGYNGIIIALTGFSDNKTRALCRERGMNHFMAKPFDMAKIKEYGLLYKRAD
jgi:CheY-like chemotaxis protein